MKKAIKVFVNSFRKLLVRFEKKDRNYRGLIEFAFAIIIWRKLIPVHEGIVIAGQTHEIFFRVGAALTGVFISSKTYAFIKKTLFFDGII
jgi:hypothetical protein